MHDSHTSRAHTLRSRGYLHLPGLLDADDLEPASHAIARDIARHYDPKKERHYSHTSYCPRLRHRRVITNLRKHPALHEIMTPLIDWEHLRFGRGQIAIRWAHSAKHPEPPSWHIDGVPTVDNGLRGRALDTFDVLVGIFLTKTPGEDAGNFTVWPGSHTLLSEHFRTRGERALHEGMPEPRVSLGKPTQLVTSPGDVVIAHYLLAHGVAKNVSETDRVAVFFRGKLRRRSKDKWRDLAECWRRWRLIDPDAPDDPGALP